MNLNIVPECYFDTVLVKSILNIKEVNHQQGCDNVMIALRDSKKLKDDFALAIIDKDKRELGYIKDNFTLVSDRKNLVLLKHKDKHHFVIQLVPAIEQWILNVIDESGLDDLGISTELNELKKLTKYKYVSENEDLKRLCRKLINSDIETMNTLKNWLTYLYKENRKADINYLTNV